MAVEEQDFNEIANNAKLEDLEPLNYLVGMLRDRMSVVDYGDNSDCWDRLLSMKTNTTLIEILSDIRWIICNIANRFINMDYPYWDKCWSTFPQMYSQTILDQDEEHNLQVWPVRDSSFDNASIDQYRKFLKSAYYWLKKFRYVRSRQSAYDEIYWRSWSWYQWPQWDNNGGSYTYDALENGHGVENPTAGTLALLQQSGQGVLQSTGGDLTTLTLQCEMNNSNRIEKKIDHASNSPLYQLEFKAQDQQFPRRADGIPHNLITANPTCFAAEVLWFVVPNVVPYKKHVETVVTPDSGTPETWGWQRQFTGRDYDAEESSTTTEEYESRRGQDKLVKYENRQLNKSQTGTNHTILTRWSDDGTRSYEYSNTTTTDSQSPFENHDLDYEEYVYPTFGGLVQPLSSAPPTFSVGWAAPHQTITFHAFDQNALPTDYPIPTVRFSEDPMYGITSNGVISYRGATKWYPVLDFKDFSTEVPDPEEG